jgi:hypothetical protein
MQEDGSFQLQPARCRKGKLLTTELLKQGSPEATIAPKPATIAEDLLCDMELPLRGVFYPLGFPVEIVTNEQAVLDAANDSWGYLRPRQMHSVVQLRISVSEGGGSECPPTPVSRANRHLFSIVADTDNQAIVDLKAGFAAVWLNQAAIRHSLYLRYYFLEGAAYILLCSSAVTSLHAACVSRYGRGILLCGDSGAGKSSLSYACARAGWTYTSDDASYLLHGTDDPRVIGNSHQVRFRPTAKTLFPELEGRALTPRAEGKPSIEVPTSELPGLITASEARVDFIVYLKRGSSETGELLPLPDGAAIERIRENLYPIAEIRAIHEEAVQVLSGVPAYELRYRDFDHAIGQLDRLVRSHA